MTLEIEDLVVEYPSRGFRTSPYRALHGVSLRIAPGETLGLVGESGSGKTTIGRAVLGLAPVTSGSIRLDGQEISSLSRRARRPLARRVQVVFQDPYTSLNPVMQVGDILAEPLRAQGLSRSDASTRISTLLGQVGLPPDAISRTPREFSGGQRQRVAIARALAIDPELIVCDEPVSALDLTTQARVLALLTEIQERTGVSYLFISHDLAVVRAISHRVAVLYGGRIVEEGDAGIVTAHPVDPYTQKLLLSAPVPDPVEQTRRRTARLALVDGASAAVSPAAEAYRVRSGDAA
ncbi:MAG: ATP-binding cassette domain-containing protein [Lacisediminihabitans sp.]